MPPKKTRAEIEREIKTSLEQFDQIRRARRGAVLRAIRAAPVAVVLTDRNGRETLAIVTREMSNPEEGAWRASVYWRDGPVGHVTRKTLGAIASELAADYTPEDVRGADDAEVMAWTDTDDFREGTRRVAEVQAWNAGRR